MQRQKLPTPVITGEPAAHLENPLLKPNPPLLAIWQSYAAPGLRVAVWPDGRVVFARDPNAWGRELFLGQLSQPALKSLKIALRKMGVFSLKGTCYLVPDGSQKCIMLSFDGMKQMLYWDEVENPSYGINVNSKQQHIAFKKAWWEVTKIILTTLPPHAKRLTTHFKGAPREWYIKPTIQSE